MKRTTLDSNPRVVESLFAAERELVPESDELRNRVLQRARAALRQDRSLLAEEGPAKSRRVRVGLAAAAVVMLSGMCALAYVAGYHARTRTPATPSPQPTIVPSDNARASAPSVIVAIVPVTAPADSLVAGATLNPAAQRAAKTPAIGSAKATIDVEAYTKELRLLQPARQAVARQDYASALRAVAEHQSQFPGGKLAEEREALRVKSLLGLGRTTEAQRAGAAFHARFPHSALLGRVDEMLGTRK